MSDSAANENPEPPVARVHKAQINPDIDSISSLELYDGQRVRHELIYGIVKDRRTGDFHHDYATFKTLRKTKHTPWKTDPRASFTLTEDKAGELSKALDFLAACRAWRQTETLQPDLDEPVLEHRTLMETLASLDAEDRLEISLKLLRDLRNQHDPRMVMALIEQNDNSQIEATAQLFLIASRRKTLREFHRLLKEPDTTPGEFRKLFFTQPWLIGSEACQTLALEGTPLEDSADLLLQRTPDNWLELLLIRTPLAEHHLFHGDQKSGWFPVPELQMAISRTHLILEKLTAENFWLEDEWSLQGCRARLLIGHLHGDPIQEVALQRYNRHLKHVEILSYDQIDRNAIRALTRLQNAGKAQLRS